MSSRPLKIVAYGSLTVLIAMMMAATFVERFHGADTAARVIYHHPVFFALWAAAGAASAPAVETAPAVPAALTGDEAAMTAVCGSADALHLLLKEGDPEGELAPFERAAISFGLGSSIGAVLRSAPAGLFSITEYGPDAVLTGYPSGVDHNFSPGGVFVCESLYYSAYGGRQITIISLLTGDTCFTGKSTVVGTPSPLTPALAMFGGVRVVCTVRNIGVCGFFCEPL